MAVPAHDQRDFDFAKTFDLEIIPVVDPEIRKIDVYNLTEAFEAEGTMINSGKFNGMNNKEAIEKIIEYLEEKGIGKKTVNYKLRDWLISRQRYWGTPIPMIHCDDCGWVPEKEENLPVLLPADVEFTGKGESPLATSKTFVTRHVRSAASLQRENWILWIRSWIPPGISCATAIRRIQKRRSAKKK